MVSFQAYPEQHSGPFGLIKNRKMNIKVQFRLKWESSVTCVCLYHYLENASYYCRMVRILKENLNIRQKGGVTDTYPPHGFEYVSMTRKIAIKMLPNFNISSIK